MTKIIALLIGLIMTASVCVSCEKVITVIGDKYRNFYEIYVGGFYDSDGDGMGDLRGVIRKLDYLNDGGENKNSLGVDGLWLMPVMPSPSYHKYDVTDYYAIDSAYGGMADFEELAAQCDKRGIMLIIDLVLNHTSNQHPWFLSATASLKHQPCGQDTCVYDDLCPDHNPYCRYYYFSDEKLPDYYETSGGYYYLGTFGGHMPDLDLSNPVVRIEIADIARFWLGKGVGGFRLDAALHYFEGNAAKNAEFLSWFTTIVESENPDVYLVAEVWADGGTLLQHYGGVDSMFNFPFAQSQGYIAAALRQGQGQILSKRIESWQSQLLEVNPNAIDAAFVSNHDISRSAGFFGGDTRVIKMAAAVYLFMPGNTFIYYGEEIGMTGSGKDENKRLPMMFSSKDAAGRPDPPNDADPDQVLRNLGIDVNEQLKDKQSILRFYMEAIKLKNRYPEIARGVVASIETDNPALCVFVTAYGEEAAYIIHNMSGENATVSLTGEFAGLKLSGSLAAGGGKVKTAGSHLVMPGYSTAVLKKR